MILLANSSQPKCSLYVLVKSLPTPQLSILNGFNTNLFFSNYTRSNGLYPFFYLSPSVFLYLPCLSVSSLGSPPLDPPPTHRRTNRLHRGSTSFLYSLLPLLDVPPPPIATSVVEFRQDSTAPQRPSPFPPHPTAAMAIGASAPAFLGRLLHFRHPNTTLPLFPLPNRPAFLRLPDLEKRGRLDNR